MDIMWMITIFSAAEYPWLHVQWDTVHWRPTKSCWWLEIHNMDVCNTWWQNNKSLCWHMFTCGISNFQTNQLLLVVLTYIPIGLCLYKFQPTIGCTEKPFHTIVGHIHPIPIVKIKYPHSQLVECYPRRLGLREHVFRKPQSISWDIP